MGRKKGPKSARRARADSASSEGPPGSPVEPEGSPNADQEEDGDSQDDGTAADGEGEELQDLSEYVGSVQQAPMTEVQKIREEYDDRFHRMEASLSGIQELLMDMRAQTQQRDAFHTPPVGTHAYGHDRLHPMGHQSACPPVMEQHFTTQARYAALAELKSQLGGNFDGEKKTVTEFTKSFIECTTTLPMASKLWVMVAALEPQLRQAIWDSDLLVQREIAAQHGNISTATDAQWQQAYGRVYQDNDAARGKVDEILRYLSAQFPEPAPRTQPILSMRQRTTESGSQFIRRVGRALNAYRYTMGRDLFGTGLVPWVVSEWLRPAHAAKARAWLLKHAWGDRKGVNLSLHDLQQEFILLEQRDPDKWKPSAEYRAQTAPVEAEAEYGLQEAEVAPFQPVQPMHTTTCYHCGQNGHIRAHCPNLGRTHPRRAGSFGTPRGPARDGDRRTPGANRSPGRSGGFHSRSTRGHGGRSQTYRGQAGAIGAFPPADSDADETWRNISPVDGVHGHQVSARSVTENPRSTPHKIHEQSSLDQGDEEHGVECIAHAPGVECDEDDGPWAEYRAEVSAAKASAAARATIGGVVPMFQRAQCEQAPTPVSSHMPQMGQTRMQITESGGPTGNQALYSRTKEAPECCGIDTRAPGIHGGRHFGVTQSRRGHSPTRDVRPEQRNASKIRSIQENLGVQQNQAHLHRQGTALDSYEQTRASAEAYSRQTTLESRATSSFEYQGEDGQPHQPKWAPDRRTCTSGGSGLLCTPTMLGSSQCVLGQSGNNSEPVDNGDEVLLDQFQPEFDVHTSIANSVNGHPRREDDPYRSVGDGFGANALRPSVDALVGTAVSGGRAVGCGVTAVIAGVDTSKMMQILVGIGGHKEQMAIDTGASFSLVGPEFARWLCSKRVWGDDTPGTLHTLPTPVGAHGIGWGRFDIRHAVDLSFEIFNRTGPPVQRVVRFGVHASVHGAMLGSKDLPVEFLQDLFQNAVWVKDIADGADLLGTPGASPCVQVSVVESVHRRSDLSEAMGVEEALGELYHQDTTNHLDKVVDGLMDAHAVDGPKGEGQPLTLGKFAEPDNDISAGFKRLRTKYAPIFAELDDQPSRLRPARYELDDPAKSEMKIRPIRRFSVNEEKHLVAMRDKQLALDVIERVPHNQRYRSNLHLVYEPSKVRVVLDVRDMNKLLKKDRRAMANAMRLIERTEGCKVFSALDLRSGYFQQVLEESSREFTTFSTHEGTYRYKRNCFGITGAPSQFCGAMEEMLDELPEDIRQWVFVFVDDILVATKDRAMHLRVLHALFAKLCEYNLRLSVEKCKIAVDEVDFLGYCRTQYGLRPAADKVKAITALPAPTKVREVQALMGMAGYQARFIPHYSTLVEPLRRLTAKGVDWRWERDEQAAFDELKRVLTHAPVLKVPDPDGEFVLHTDASAYGAGAVLCQEHVDDDGSVTVRPCEYWSRAFTPAERRYSTTEREMLAAVAAMHHFRIHLQSARFTLVTDHAALKWMLSASTGSPLSDRAARWLAIVQGFAFDVVYRKGELCGDADALSRFALQPDVVDAVQSVVAALIAPVRGHSILEDATDGEDADPNEAAMPRYKRRADATSKAKKGSGRRKGKQRKSGAGGRASRAEESEEEDNKEEDEEDEDPAAEEKNMLDDPITPADLRELQEEDAWVRQQRELFRVRDGILYQESGGKLRLALPLPYRNEAMQRAHRGWTAHGGAAKTKTAVAARYTWHGLSRDVKAFCAQCRACGQAKRGNAMSPSVRPREKLATPTRVGERIGIDLVGPIRESASGSKHILVITDALSKYALAIPIADQTAATVASVLLTDWVCVFGAPQIIVSDRGANLLHEVVARVSRLWGARRHHTTAYNPRANGLTERANRTLVEALRAFVLEGEGHDDWDTYMHVVTLWQQTTTQRFVVHTGSPRTT